MSKPAAPAVEADSVEADEVVRYRSTQDDSARWTGFPFRDGDIVISTCPKSGTTWMQMICALLVLRTPQLPVPLAQLSPWLDWLLEPRVEVLARLAAQSHRRIIKTHTPLDGIPLDDRATYVVVARHPLDAAVSRHHQSGNLDRRRIRQLTGQSEPIEPPAPTPPPLEWLLAWIDRDGDPRQDSNSLPGVMWHLSDAWARRDRHNMVLVHYDDLQSDLSGEMRRLATRLGIDVPEQEWPGLVEAASFERMRRHADVLAPDTVSVFIDRTAFFRKGRSGEGRRLLTPEEIEHYHRRAARFAPPDLLKWLHRPLAD
ncbi:sulfotransferase domain-containing protein [Micromonospora sp. RTGN7]|uniref:sulfotransferase domain-containing protein n=1 Tax=Micromonospora sp. RTGN7 TaxID=3016526 RepID=UPI0029FF092B|nr:sulfotransferase domain-containing protein [Micromonospora sp. RTGN7]